MESAPQAELEASPLRVSIIIVSQNQKELLDATLKSLAARQDPEQSEVIVVDCGSIDGSNRMDDHYEGITLLRLPRNFGWTKAMNIATRTAKADYLFLLPNGVEVAPDTVQVLLHALESDPQAGATCPAGELYSLPPAGAAKLPGPGPNGNYPFDHPVLFPKLAVKSMNYLPEKYGQFYADLELFHKMQEAGKRVVVLNDHKLSRKRAPFDMFDAETAQADQIAGLGAYYSKNFGFGAGMSFWLGQCFQALFSFRFGLFFQVLGGSKVDGL